MIIIFAITFVIMLNIPFMVIKPKQFSDYQQLIYFLIDKLTYKYILKNGYN